MSLIKKGDLVEVITGPYRGERGEVLQVLPRNNRVVVKGLNMRVKHLKVRPTEQGGQTGGITEMEAPMDLSNVMIVDPKTQKPARLGVVREADGKRKRVTRGRNSSGTVID
jgi:large subunit ribosomal protein L24